MLAGYGYVYGISILCCIVCLLISAWALRCLFYIRWAMRRPLKCGTTTVGSTFFLCTLLNYELGSKRAMVDTELEYSFVIKINNLK